MLAKKHIKRRLANGVAASVAVIGVSVLTTPPAFAKPWVLYGNYSSQANCQEQGRNLLHYMSYMYRDYVCILDAPNYWRLWVERTDY